MAAESPEFFHVHGGKNSSEPFLTPTMKQEYAMYTIDKSLSLFGYTRIIMIIVLLVGPPSQLMRAHRSNRQATGRLSSPACPACPLRRNERPDDRPQGRSSIRCPTGHVPFNLTLKSLEVDVPCPWCHGLHDVREKS